MRIRFTVWNASVDGQLMEASEGIEVIDGFLSSEIVLSLLFNLSGHCLRLIWYSSLLNGNLCGNSFGRGGFSDWSDTALLSWWETRAGWKSDGWLLLSFSRNWRGLFLSLVLNSSRSFSGLESTAWVSTTGKIISN